MKKIILGKLCYRQGNKIIFEASPASIKEILSGGIEKFSFSLVICDKDDAEIFFKINQMRDIPGLQNLLIIASGAGENEKMHDLVKHVCSYVDMSPMVYPLPAEVGLCQRYDIHYNPVLKVSALPSAHVPLSNILRQLEFEEQLPSTYN